MSSEVIQFPPKPDTPDIKPQPERPAVDIPDNDQLATQLAAQIDKAMRRWERDKFMLDLPGVSPRIRRLDLIKQSPDHYVVINGRQEELHLTKQKDRWQLDLSKSTVTPEIAVQILEALEDYNPY